MIEQLSQYITIDKRWLVLSSAGGITTTRNFLGPREIKEEFSGGEADTRSASYITTKEELLGGRDRDVHTRSHITTIGHSISRVQGYIRDHSLQPELREAISRASECFDEVRRITLSCEEDPETEDEWLEIGIEVGGSTAQIIDAHRRYLRELRQQSPQKIREHIRICLTVSE